MLSEPPCILRLLLYLLQVFYRYSVESLFGLCYFVNLRLVKGDASRRSCAVLSEISLANYQYMQLHAVTRSSSRASSPTSSPLIFVRSNEVQWHSLN